MLACEVANLCQSYPAIVPPSPGVLCAFGDACTSMRYEVTTTLLRRLAELSIEEVEKTCMDLASNAASVLEKQGIPPSAQLGSWEADLRYRGQGLTLSVPFTVEELKEKGFKILEERFHESHKTLFTFALEVEVEMCNLRAVVKEVLKDVVTMHLEKGSGVPAPEAVTQKTNVVSPDFHLFLSIS